MDDDSPWKRTSIEDYAKIIRRTDAAIGSLLSQLSQLPNAADVLVIVTADHGEEFGEHGERYHGFTLYEEGVRVPIIAWSPRDHRRFLSSAPPATTAGLGRYLLDAVALPAEPDAGATPPGILLRTVMADRQFGVLLNGWKLIYNASRNAIELFDLRHDPHERENLTNAAPEKVMELGRALGRLLSPDASGAGPGVAHATGPAAALHKFFN